MHTLTPDFVIGFGVATAIVGLVVLFFGFNGYRLYSPHTGPGSAVFKFTSEETLLGGIDVQPGDTFQFGISRAGKFSGTSAQSVPDGVNSIRVIGSWVNRP